MGDLAVLLGLVSPATWSLSYTFFVIGRLAGIGGGGFALWVLWNEHRSGSLSLRLVLWASGACGVFITLQVLLWLMHK